MTAVRKVGRPRVPDADLKRVVPVRLTDRERASYEAAAEAAGLSLSSWIRDVLGAAAGGPERIVEASKVKYKGKVLAVSEAVKAPRPVVAQLPVKPNPGGCRLHGWVFCRGCRFGICRHNENPATCPRSECKAVRE